VGASNRRSHFDDEPFRKASRQRGPSAGATSDLIVQTQQWLVIGLTVLGLLAVLGWRKPTALLLIVLATFVVGPEGVLRDHVPGSLLRWVVPVQQGLLILALLANALRHGIRLQPSNWPLLVVSFLVLGSLVLADRSEILGIERILMAAIALGLPWGIANVVLEAGSRQRLAVIVAFLPMVSVAVGVAFRWAGLQPLESGDAVTVFGLPAATHPSWLGLLAFAGFALAGHEALRNREIGLAALASIDLAIAMAAGGRMAAVACLAFVATYVILADEVRENVGRRVAIAVAGTAAIAALMILMVPLASLFVTEPAADEAVVVASLGVQERIWAEYMLDFLLSPLFGLGLGASTLVGYYADLPHNEYLRLLVETGVVGLLLYTTAIMLWGREFLAGIRSADRPFALALFGTLALIAAIDNLLFMPPTLVLFVYLDCIMREPRRHQRGREEVPASVARSVALAVGRSTASSGLAPAASMRRASALAPGDHGRERSAPPGPGPIQATLRRAGLLGVTSHSLSLSRPTNGDVSSPITGSAASSVPAGHNGVPLPAIPRSLPPPTPNDGSAPAAGQAPGSAMDVADATDPPEDLAARIRRQIELGQLALARTALEGASESLRGHALVEGAKAALALAEQAQGLPTLEALLGRLKADEHDHAARIDLATALFGRNQLEEAIDLLLNGVRKNREGRGQAVREQLLEFFTALGPDHPVTVEGRRKLAAGAGRVTMPQSRRAG
jgi:O-antigen ligase